MKHRLFIDGDEQGWFLRSRDPLWTDAEMVKIEAKRLLRMFPKLGVTALIFRSDNGWHVRFNQSRLTWPEMVAALCESKIEHHGHRLFSILLQDDTIRVSRKPDKNSHKPYLVEIIKIGRCESEKV